MLKIETSSPHPTELRVTLSGRVEREYLPELERLVGAALAGHRRVSFDLQRVSLVDREAVEFFASGPARFARLESCPSYLRAWLQSVGRCCR